MLVKVPPFIMKPEELGKNDMIWWFAICKEEKLGNGAL